MSTDWGYVCQSHDPTIESEHWFNHGDDLLTVVALLVRDGRWPYKIDPLWPNDPEPSPVQHGGWETAAPIHWLSAHPECRIALRNEYGDTKSLPLAWKPDVLRDSLRSRMSALSDLVHLIDSCPPKAATK